MKTKVILVTVFFIMLISFTYSLNLSGFQIVKPSENLTAEQKNELITTNKYIWQSQEVWKSGDCYYYDLSIGNETKTQWRDKNRLLICTKNNLSDSQLEQLQLENIELTLREVATTSERRFTRAQTGVSAKGENLNLLEVS